MLKRFSSVAMSAILAMSLSPTAAFASTLQVDSAKTVSTQAKTKKATVYVLSKLKSNTSSKPDKYKYNKNGLLIQDEVGYKYEYKGALLVKSYDKDKKQVTTYQYDKKNRRISETMEWKGEDYKRPDVITTITYTYKYKNGKVSEVTSDYQRQSTHTTGRIYYTSYNKKGHPTRYKGDKGYYISYDKKGNYTFNSRSPKLTRVLTYDKKGRIKKIGLKNYASYTKPTYKKMTVNKKYLSTIKRQQYYLLNRPACPYVL